MTWQPTKPFMSTKTMHAFKNDLSLVHSIRGLAAFYVVIFHAKFVLWSGGREFTKQFPRHLWSIFDYLNVGLTIIFNSGTQMVMIFFVLSGFFISMSLDRRYPTFLNKLKSFYTIRAIRIYTPYITSIFWAVFILWGVGIVAPHLITLGSHREFNVRLTTAFHDITLKNLFKSFVFLKENEYIGFNLVYWSLLYEGLFYLIVVFIQPFKRSYLIVSFVLYVVGLLLPSVSGSNNLWAIYFFQYNFYFAIGQAVYFYKKSISNFFENKNCKLFILILSTLLFVLFDLLKLMELNIYANLLAALTGALLMILLLYFPIRKNYLVRFAQFLGKISYSLYLAHFPVLILVYTAFFLITGKTVYFGFEFLIGVGLSLLAGWALYEISERPSMAWIRAIKRNFGIN